jgi:hypothetical protein
MSTRHAREGDPPAEPSDGSDDQVVGRTGIGTKPLAAHSPPVDDEERPEAEGHDNGDQHALYVKDRPSHEDVARLEADNDRTQRNNEAKNMVFDAIYDQLPEKIQSEMFDCGIGWRSKDAGFQFSKLSEAELKRLTKWLLEHKPFAELKESEYADPVKVSVEEENPDGADGVPVFPHVSATPSAQDECAHSRGKKTVQRTNSVLGSGSYGEVSVVKHKGICYAAKELKLEDSALVDNLYREAANLALLDDDNIVKFCGIGVYEKHHRQGVFLILTELLATSLHRYLMKGVGISLPNQVSLLSQVLSGLEYMHQAPSVIHGDLKTRNVLLSEKGIAKIGDLGSSHLANDSIVGQDVCGTEAYMAPEMASGDYTKKMDVFAYGHLALVTLTRWEVDTAEFSTPKPNSPNKEIEKRKKLFAMLKRPTYAVVGEFVPLIRACLCDKPAERLALDRLKDQMQDLRLPRELPNVQTDTAVREI